MSLSLLRKYTTLLQNTQQEVSPLVLEARMKKTGLEPEAGGGGDPPAPTAPTESPGEELKAEKGQDPPARIGLTRRVGGEPEIERGENRT
jgi:hypothetical protein